MRLSKFGVDKDPSNVCLRLRVLSLIFGLDPDVIAAWPGGQVFCTYVEKSLYILANNTSQGVWTVLDQPTPGHHEICWHLCLSVLEIFQSLGDDEATLERVYKRLIENYKKTPREILPVDKQTVLQAIFAVLCCTSMALEPVVKNPDPTSQEATISVHARNISKIYSSNSLRVPIHKVFRSFRATLGTRNLEAISVSPNGNIEAGLRSGEMLYAATLNFASLSTIGRVRVAWVNDLSSHLIFDRPTRTLYVFRFPTYCVLNVLDKNRRVRVLQRLASEMLSSPDVASPDSSQSALKEVLLSYRVLFGQSKASRKLARRLLDARDREEPEQIDPLLRTLCTGPLRRWAFRGNSVTTVLPGYVFPLSTLNFDNELEEADVYSAFDDFPTFGTRLLDLQRYNLRQQPRRIIDLWRDRRNPLQWYTFWAVLWLGAVATILSVLQLAVGIAQLYYST